MRRYGPGGSLWAGEPAGAHPPIRSWQIWNEPSLGCLLVQSPQAREYASMLRVVGGEIKSEDPGAEIVTAGLPDSKLKSTMLLDRFISRLNRAKGKRYFDTLAINGYATSNAQLSELLHRVRRNMNRHGDRRAGLDHRVRWGDAGPAHRFNAGPQGAKRIVPTVQVAGEAEAKLRLRGRLLLVARPRPYPPKYNDMWGLRRACST